VRVRAAVSLNVGDRKELRWQLAREDCRHGKATS
jgi:hypothetical protein